MCDQRQLFNGDSFGQRINTSMDHSRCYRKYVYSSPTSSEGYEYRQYHRQSTEKADFKVNKYSSDILRTTVEKPRVHANTCQYEVENIPKRRDRIQADLGTMQQSENGKYTNYFGKTNNVQLFPQCSNNTNDNFPAPVMESLSNPYTKPSGARNAGLAEVINVSDDDEIEYTYMFDPFPLDSTEETINNTNWDEFNSRSNHEHPSPAHVLNLSTESQLTSLQNQTDNDVNKTQDCLIKLNGVTYNQSPSQLMYSDIGTMQTGYYQSCLTISSKAGPCEQEQVGATGNTRKSFLPCYPCAVGESNMCGCVQIQLNDREDSSKGRVDVNNYNLKSSQIYLSNGINHNQFLQALPNQQPGGNMTELEYDYGKQSHTRSNNQKTKPKEHTQNYFVQECQQLVPKQLLEKNEKQQCLNEISHKTPSPKATFISVSNNRTTAKDVHKDKGLHASLADLHSNCDRCRGCKRLNLKLKAAVM